MQTLSARDELNIPTVLGILAHVDAGKTTLSERILLETGVLRKAGRVDDGNTVMDAHALEKERGITIFSGAAPFGYGGRQFTLLDTPGHVDFSAEMERTLAVLDAAVLVISGTDGVQAHTRTLWRLLEAYRVPTFLFVTKMDYARHARAEMLSEFVQEFGDKCADFSEPGPSLFEQVAMTDDEALQAYLESGSLPDETVRRCIRKRAVFPCFFGSGLTGAGITEFLDGLSRYAMSGIPAEAALETAGFSANIFKITHEGGNPITHLKVTGGTLPVRAVLGENGEKVNQIRVYTGEKYRLEDSAGAGEIVAVTGIPNLRAGDFLGKCGVKKAPVLEPVMRYTVELPDGLDPILALPKMRELEAEDPLLHVTWNSFLKEIQVGLMGEVQAEILTRLLKDRFGLNACITKGHVLYKETIRAKVEGVGHYEPLRHYAEVHLMLEPLPKGSGLEFRAHIPEEILDRNFQRLILTHLTEKEHVGVLTGSPITDMRISLVNGRSHIKHTEGGDFREATYRALRQGLMQAENVLLEPYYRFTAEVPSEVMNRVVNDVRKMGSTFEPPTFIGNVSTLTGRAAVSEMNDYAKTVASYSGGTGKLLLDFDGYDLCHNPDEVLNAFSYNPEADLENTPDSVFCDHGAGFLVKWNEVFRYQHLENQK